MANAKKCDICGKLYEDFDSTLKLDGPKVYAVNIKIKKGGNNLDLCSFCLVKYARLYSEHTVTCEQTVVE